MSKRCNDHTPSSHPCNLPARHPVDMHECASGCCSWGSYTDRATGKPRLPERTSR